MQREHAAVLLGCSGLAFLAAWLWGRDVPGCHGVGWADPDLAARHAADEDRVEPARSLLVTYDDGRTTIPPKISDAAIARIRGL